MSAQTRQIVNRLRELGDPDIAARSQRFFKTAPGQYGEGNKFPEPHGQAYLKGTR